MTDAATPPICPCGTPALYSMKSAPGTSYMLNAWVSDCEVIGADIQLMYLAVSVPDNLVVVVKFAAALPGIQKVHGAPLPDFVYRAVDKAREARSEQLPPGLLPAVPALDEAGVFSPM